jgi:hypothetical protein
LMKRFSGVWMSQCWKTSSKFCTRHWATMNVTCTWRRWRLRRSARAKARDWEQSWLTKTLYEHCIIYVSFMFNDKNKVMEKCIVIIFLACGASKGCWSKRSSLHSAWPL